MDTVAPLPVSHLDMSILLKTSPTAIYFCYVEVYVVILCVFYCKFIYHFILGYACKQNMGFFFRIAFRSSNTKFDSEYIKRKLYQTMMLYRNRIKPYSVTLIQMHLNNISSLCTTWKCINVPVVKLNSILIPLFMLFPFGSFLHYFFMFQKHYICIKMLWKI